MCDDEHLEWEDSEAEEAEALQRNLYALDEEIIDEAIQRADSLMIAAGILTTKDGEKRMSHWAAEFGDGEGISNISEFVEGAQLTAKSKGCSLDLVVFHIPHEDIIRLRQLPKEAWPQLKDEEIEKPIEPCKQCLAMLELPSGRRDGNCYGTGHLETVGEPTFTETYFPPEDCDREHGRMDISTERRNLRCPTCFNTWNYVRDYEVGYKGCFIHPVSIKEESDGQA